MGFWDIVLPLATTNLVTNPSAELAATTGFAAMSGSIASSSAQQRYGVYSVAVTPNSASDDGVYYGTVSLTSGTTYTFSAWVKGVAAVPMRVYFANTSGTLQGSATLFTATGNWERQEVSWACNSTTTYRVYVTKISSNSTGVFYVDAIQVEALTAATTYCDGDQEGCAWNGTAHAATSSRSAQSRAGGQIVNLDSYGFYVIQSPGIGMPSITHQAQDYALLPGAYYQGSRAGVRVFDLVADIVGTSRADLHSKRKSLVAALRPDSTGTQQPFRLIYSGTGVDIETWVVYDSGFSFEQPDGYTERVAVRLIGYDPFWYSGSGGAVLDTNDTATARYSAGRLASAGQWNNLGLSSNPSGGGTVYAVAVSPVTGKVYFGGDFTGWGAVAGRDYCACYDPSTGTWSDVGADNEFSAAVMALCFHPSGTLYIGGYFRDAGAGSDGDSLAQYVESTNTVTSVVAGAGDAGDAVLSLAVDSTGNLYVGGIFAAWGDADGDSIVKWSGSALSSLGTGIATAGTHYVYAIAVDKSDNVYAGGDFASAGGVSDTAYIAKWNGSAWSSIGVPEAAVRAMACDAAGNIYVGGTFVNIDSDTTLANIAKYNGGSWEPMVEGVSNTVYAVHYDSNSGLIHISGAFSYITGLAFVSTGYVIWNGSSWVYSDILFASGYPLAIATYEGLYGSDVYIGTSSTATVTFSGDTTITNSGTAESYPVIKINRSGGTTARLRYLENATSGVKVWCNYALGAGETITLDFRPGKRIAKSSIGKDIWYAILRGSEFAKFSLLPGSNLITCFVDTTGSPTITTTMQWDNAHWSADGSAP